MVMDLERLMAEVVARSSARCMCGKEGYDIDELISTFINFDRVRATILAKSRMMS